MMSLDNKNIQKPEPLITYKYRGFSKRTLEILLNRELFFSLPNNLNDPLDSHIDIDAEYKKVVATLNPTRDEETNRKAFLIYILNSKKFHTSENTSLNLNQALQQFIETLGILSMSLNPKDALLWSHYADSHKGICLGFDSALIQPERMFVSEKVSYLAKPPYQELFLELADELGEFCRPWDKNEYPDELGDKFYTNQISKLLRANLLVKSEKWKYEEEYRYIKVQDGFYNFEPQALKTVILGTKVLDADAKTIINLLATNPSYSHVSLKKARHIEGTFEFEIADYTET